MPIFPTVFSQIKQRPFYIKTLALLALALSVLVAWPLVIAAAYSRIVSTNLRQLAPRVVLIAAMLIPALIMEVTWGKTVVATLSPSSDNSQPSHAQLAQAPPQPKSTPQVQSATDQQHQTATVLRAVTGDSLDVDIDGSPYRVHLIGLKAPKLADKSIGQAECFGPESQMFLDSLLKKQQVQLSSDSKLDNRSQSSSKDQSTLHRYVSMKDGTEVNSLMLEAGLAKTSGQKHHQEAKFKAQQSAAKQSKKGLWLNCDDTKSTQPDSGYPQITRPTSSPTPLPVTNNSPIKQF